MQSSYPQSSYPVLQPAEILETCRGVGLNLVAGDLNHPTPVQAQNIYAFWLHLILDISVDDIINATNERLDLLPDPELYREATYIGVFKLTVEQLLLRAAVHDFAVSDLTAPTTVRLVRNISALVNFSLFEREQATEYLEPLQAEDDELQAREQELLAKNQGELEKIQHEREVRKMNAPRAKSAAERVAATKRQLSTMNDDALLLRKESDNMGGELKQLTVELSDIQKMITQNELELNRLKRQHVQSPERLRANIQEMSASVQKDQENVRTLEQRERQHQAKLSALTKYEQDLSAVIRIMDEWEIDVGKLAEATSRHQQHVDMYDTLVAEQFEIENTIGLLKRRIMNAVDELNRFGEKSDRKRAANKQRKKSLAEHYTQLLEQKATYDMQAAAKNREAMDVENQIRATREELHRELDKGEAEYKRIKDQVSLYSIRVNKALDSLNSLNSQPLDLSLTMPLPSVPAIPAIPIPTLVATLFAQFPLKTYPAPPTSALAPPSPTLWLLGPPPPPSTESFDPLCRQAQALARFTSPSSPLVIRWLPSPASAPGGTLPALHLPSGALLSTPEVLEHFLPSAPATTPPPGSSPSFPTTPDARHQAFLALLTTTLLPAVLASLSLSPNPPAVVPQTELPLLSGWAAAWTGVGERRERIDEVLRLRGRKVGVRAVLDLEELEWEGVETLGALEEVVKGPRVGQWFGGSAAPTALDALLYALLSIVLLQRSAGAAPLKEKLERCPALLAWVSSRQP